jgi:hypothetical protein
MSQPVRLTSGQPLREVCLIYARDGVVGGRITSDASNEATTSLLWRCEEPLLRTNGMHPLHGVVAHVHSLAP